MKKINEKREEWLLARVRRRSDNLSWAAAVRKNRGRTSADRRRLTKRPPVAVVALPSSLMAERIEARVLIGQTIHSVLQRLHGSAAQIRLDFTKVQRIYPGGMLMLLASLELMCEAYPGRISASVPRGSLAAQLLHHFGYASRLRVPSNGNAPRHKSVIDWQFATGRLAEGAKIKEHLDSIASQVGEVLPEGLYDALSEAMVNVQHHAYPAEGAVPEALRRWWVFSKCRRPTQTEPGTVYLAFYDIGVGIQASLRARLRGLTEHALDALERALGTIGLSDGLGQDGNLLRVAVEHNRSATGLPFRGKGLPEMREFAARTIGGRMTIISGKGQYTFAAESGQAMVSKHDAAILGTLILWNLPLTWQEEATP